jgi:hypothetical protein
MTNRGKKRREEILLFFFWNKYVIIKQVKENLDEVHEVYPIDQVKVLTEHKDIQVEMYMRDQNFLVAHNQSLFYLLLNQVFAVLINLILVLLMLVLLDHQNHPLIYTNLITLLPKNILFYFKKREKFYLLEQL